MMAEQSLWMLFLGGVLLNNCALQSFFGVGPLLGFSKTVGKALGMGLSVTVVQIVTAALVWPVQHFLLAPYELVYFQTMVFVLLTAAVAGVLSLAAKKLLGAQRSRWLLLVTLNSAVLGTLLVNAAEELSFVQAMVASAASGLGFLLALVVFAGVRSKIEDRFVPKAFRGLPIQLLAAMILSLALFAF